MEILAFPIIGICCIFVIHRELKAAASIYKVERIFAIVGIALGIIVSAFIAAPLDGCLFIANAIAFWIPQVIVLAFVISLKPRPAQVAGAALALAIYLGAFYAWFSLCGKHDSMVWLGYLFSFPGAFVGSGISALYIRKRPNFGGVAVGLITSFLTLCGLGIAQLLICNTLMYCGCQ